MFRYNHILCEKYLGYHPSEYSGRNLTITHKKTHPAPDSDSPLSDQSAQQESQTLQNTVKTRETAEEKPGFTAKDLKASTAFYGSGFLPTQVTFDSEIKKIRDTIKQMRENDTLKGTALDDILAKHDELLHKRGQYIKLWESTRNPYPG